jgi:hypothetical protein
MPIGTPPILPSGLPARGLASTLARGFQRLFRRGHDEGVERRLRSGDGGVERSRR